MPDYRVLGVQGLPEVRPGDDLAALIAAAVELEDGDVLVVTSKLLSKAEGRLVPVPPGADREQVRLRAIADETVREVARRGTAVIAENRNGLVLAAAGVDAAGTAVKQDVAALRGQHLALIDCEVLADKAADRAAAQAGTDRRARGATERDGRE